MLFWRSSVGRELCRVMLVIHPLQCFCNVMSTSWLLTMLGSKGMAKCFTLIMICDIFLSFLPYWYGFFIFLGRLVIQEFLFIGQVGDDKSRHGVGLPAFGRLRIPSFFKDYTRKRKRMLSFVTSLEWTCVFQILVFFIVLKRKENITNWTDRPFKWVLSLFLAMHSFRTAVMIYGLDLF